MVAKGVGFLQSIGSSIQQALQSTKDETLAIVEQKRAQEGHVNTSSPSSSPPSTPPPVGQQETIAIPPPVSDLPPSSTENPQQVI